LNCLKVSKIKYKEIFSMKFNSKKVFRDQKCKLNIKYKMWTFTKPAKASETDMKIFLKKNHCKFRASCSSDDRPFSCRTFCSFANNVSGKPDTARLGSPRRTHFWRPFGWKPSIPRIWQQLINRVKMFQFNDKNGYIFTNFFSHCQSGGKTDWCNVTLTHFFQRVPIFSQIRLCAHQNYGRVAAMMTHLRVPL